MCKFVVFFSYQILCEISLPDPDSFYIFLEENLRDRFKHGNMMLTTPLLIAEGISELVKLVK